MRALTRRSVVAALLVMLAAAPAWAGGMFLPGRGTRALGRAGSFVAGADDLEAIYYNPAGLEGTGHGSVLLDAGLVLQRVDYTRVDSGGVTRPTVSDDNGLLPLPFAGVSWRPEKLADRVTFAFAIFTPYTGVPRFPDDGPQRYSLVSLGGTALAVAELGLSVRVTPKSSGDAALYLGGGFQVMYVGLSNKTVLAGCTELNCAPEDPRFDAATQTKTTALAPSANFGALLVTRWLRAGASVQLPYWVRSSGTVATRLPSDPMFDGAQVVGNAIDVNLDLPLIVRAGVEGRPTPRVRVELGLDWERWSMQDRVSFIPRGVYIDHVVGVGRYDLRAMSLDRSMNDTIAAHLGGEFDVVADRLTLRAGYLYETAAVPNETLSVLTPDGDKHLVAAGIGLRLGRVRLDAAYGHFFQPDRVVTNSRSLQLNPIQPANAVPVGNGTYRVAADVLSLGMDVRF